LFDRELRVGELARLVAQEIDAIAALGSRRREARELLTLRQPTRAARPVALDHDFESPERVEQARLLAGLEQTLVLVLTVDLDQQRGELAQDPRRDRAMVDPGSRAAVGRERARQDELALRIALGAVDFVDRRARPLFRDRREV